MGFLFCSFLGRKWEGVGQKLRNYLKKSKPFYKLKLIVPNLF